MQFVQPVAEDNSFRIGNSNEVSVLSHEEFGKIFTGAAIFLRPNKNSGESDYRAKKYARLLTVSLPVVFLLSLCALFIIAVVQSGLSSEGTLPFLFFSKLAGLVLTSLLVARELWPGSTMANGICKIGQKADCNAVTQHDSATVFAWVKWSDLGLAYFLSSLILLSMGQTYLPIIRALALIALPYILYSLYLQALVIKKWCPLCLGVLSLFALEYFLTTPLSFNTTAMTVISAVLYCGMIVSLALLIKFLYQHRTRSLKDKIEQRSLKRTPGVLDLALQREQKVEVLINDRSLLFGSVESFSTRVSVFLSLDCPFCADLFNKLVDKLKTTQNLQVHLILMARNVEDEKCFLLKLYRLYRSGDNASTLERLRQWYAGKHKAVAGEIFNPTEDEKKFMGENALMILKNQISSFLEI